MRYSVRFAEYEIEIPICQRCDAKHTRQGNIALVFYALGWLATTFAIFAIWHDPDEQMGLFLLSGFIAIFLTPFVGGLLLAIWGICIDRELWRDIKDNTGNEYPLAQMLIAKGWQFNKPKVRTGIYKCANTSTDRVDKLIDSYLQEARDASESYKTWCEREHRTR